MILRGPESHSTGVRVLDAVRARLAESAADAGKTIALRCCRSEAELVDGLSGLRADEVELLLFDPGACMPASERLRGALATLSLPYIEVHDDDMDALEPSLADAGDCVARVHGYAAQSYTLALAIALEHLGCAECGHGVHVGT
ncbi:type II 3-dehydroquinate dehydratase [Lysobacter silvisoli]|uniref:3-dehydroquinate dehydratase n=1 Tax=Lysobacter silvisoli TaxID=2293254 RepID=A0A371K6T5_9GAMM|nr:type II 3-dehydroquinate dehydratase [Lysobacter silvisoli]